MIVPEDPQFEKEVFRQGSPIAVPVELTAGPDGNLRLLCFSFAEPLCREFEARFGSDPLSKEARAFLEEALIPLMAARGYDELDRESYPLLDYRPGKGFPVSLDPSLPLAEVSLISTLDGEEWPDELALDEFALDPANPVDRMAVMRDADGKIVCYAGLNDISAEEGLCELNVECAEAYRGKGWGPACTAVLASRLIDLGEGVQYVASHLNEPALRCAEKAAALLGHAD